MRIVSDIAELRRATAALPGLGFVPTMGNLHAGHIALVGIARGHARHVAASIFVNRLQFAPHEDFDRYPRTFEADCAKLEAAGVDLLFAPDERVLYPEPQQFIVEPLPVANELEGAFRPRFFHGVATVVLKRGMTRARDLWAWWSLFAGAGVDRPNGAFAHRLTVRITMLDIDGTPLLVWKLARAMPIKFKAADLNARAAEVGIEEIHLVHEGLSFEAP